MNFFSELKRRNVVRMAGLYLVGAWLLTQVASTVLPMFGAPDWLPRSIVILLAMGFVPALIFSWVFELTPQGLKRDEDVPPEQSIAPQTARRMDRMIIVVLLLALGYFAFDKWVLAPRREAILSSVSPNENNSTVSAKSIAVLPFENLSSDKENAFFAAGIQDEILTRLAKIGALKVISHSSSQKYESRPPKLGVIAQDLKVANILEGSVQKAGDTVHVNVQLIRASSDEHLWAESYNRKLDDIFRVEGEIAQTVAEALNTKLTHAEHEALIAKPTQNSAAYEAYLRGLAFEGRVEALSANTLKSIEAYEEAVRLDPDFALAWAHLARQHAYAFFGSEQPSQREQAALALERAKKLGPDLAETQLAEGFYYYWVERDYDAAKTRFQEVRQKYPNNYWPPYALAAIARRQGRWDEARLLFDQAIEINPQDVYILVDAARTDIAMRDAAAAQKLLERARLLSPQNSAVIAFQAITYQLSGDLTHAQTLLNQAQPAAGDANVVFAIAYNAILSRRYEPALAILKTQLEKPEVLGLWVGYFENLLGDLQRHFGDAATAAVTYGKTRATMEELLRTQPANADRLSDLAWAEACLGDKVAALSHARQAVTLLPAAKDAYNGPDYEETLARIEARFGDRDNAITTLQHLLSISYGSPPVTAALLRLDPEWDNLRADPRFEKVCQERKP